MFVSFKIKRIIYKHIWTDVLRAKRPNWTGCKWIPLKFFFKNWLNSGEIACHLLYLLIQTLLQRLGNHSYIVLFVWCFTLTFDRGSIWYCFWNTDKGLTHFNFKIPVKYFSNIMHYLIQIKFPCAYYQMLSAFFYFCFAHRVAFCCFS